ncbi:microsomal glutathione S-transferase 1-like [Patiria miniata]|uniref:Microsomal glutathione S-transferase 1 n=1 Tax=Patiria miniata TaxID=46514 RepID=A0A914AXX5_PATMI|nr:microsomal glutathione S-transferase 1-like [Patiria miniata]
MAASTLLSFSDNPVFRLYATYASAVVLKMTFVAFQTGRLRMGRKVFINLEDAFGKKELVRRDDDIERVRRCHLNDLENIPSFLVLGLLYVLTGPSVFAATWHFRAFVASRFFHTVAYLTPLPQPARLFSYMIGVVTNISMAVQVLMNGQL